MPVERHASSPERISCPGARSTSFSFCSASPRYRGILDNWLFNDDFSWLKAARFDMAPGNILTFQVVEFFRPLVNFSFYVMEEASPAEASRLHYCLQPRSPLSLHGARIPSDPADPRQRSPGGRGRGGALRRHERACGGRHVDQRPDHAAFDVLHPVLTERVARPSGGPPGLRTRRRDRLYVLALASKEEAIAGVFILMLLFAALAPKGRRLRRTRLRPPSSRSSSCRPHTS